MGLGTQAQRNAQGALSITYYMPLWSGVLNGVFIPFHALRDGLYLELFLDDPTTFVETDGTVPIVTVSNLMLHAERLELKPQYLSEVYNYVRTNGLEFAYHSWERYISALTTGATQQITINNKSSSVNCFLNLFVNSATISSTLTNDKFITWPYAALMLQQYNALINGMFHLCCNVDSYPHCSNCNIQGVVFPDEPIVINVTNGAHGYEVYQIYCRWLNKWRLDGMIPIAPPIPLQFFADSAGVADMFLFFLDMQAYPQDPDLVNSFTTLQDNSATLIKLQFASTIPANYEMDTWLEYFKVSKIRSDGSVVVVQ